MKPIYVTTLPQDWRETKLKDLVIRKRGYTWEKEQETSIPESDTIPVVRIPNIQERLRLSDLLHLRGVTKQSLTDFGIEKNWILFISSNGNPDRIGDSVLIKEDRKMVFASFLQGITTKNPKVILPSFLSLWMKLHEVHEAFSKLSQKTTGLANFSWSAVKNLPVRYPKNVSEQQLIVSLIDTMSRMYDHIFSEMQATNRIREVMLDLLFTKGVPGKHNTFQKFKVGTKEIEIPKTWELVSLKSCIELIQYGTNSPSNDEKSGYPVIAIPQVISSTLKLGNEPYTDISKDEADKLKLQEDDILLIRTNGNPEYLAKSTLVTSHVAQQHVVFASYLIRIRTKKEKLLGSYLNFFLSSPLGRRQSLSMANTSAGNHNLGARALTQFVLPRPSITEQEKIVDMLQICESLINMYSDRLETVNRLKKAFLKNLMTGNLRIKKGVTV